MSTTPSPIDDARWRRLLDARTLGEPLDADARAFLDRYEPQSPDARAEAALLRALSSWADAPDELHEADERSDDADRTLVSDVVGRYMQAPTLQTPVAEVEQPKRSRWWIVAGLAVAASLALVWAWPRPTGEHAEAPDGAVAMDARPTAEAKPQPAQDDDEIVILSDEGLAVVSGRFEGLDDGGSVRVRGEAPACLSRGRGSRACFDPGSTLRLRGNDIDLVTGRSEVSIPEGLDVAVFDVSVAGHRVEASEGSRFVVEVERSDRVVIRVDRGRVTVLDADGESAVLESGQVRTLGQPSTTHAKPSSPSELMADARALRRSGDLEGALRMYERLLAAHPRAEAAQTARIAAGELYLQTGRAKAALRSFERYLERGGPLAEEAHHGRIRALGALGRTTAERRAIDEFLTRYPSSSYAAALRRRLDR